MFMAFISIIANIILGVILMKPLAHGGLALATSLASMLNLGLLAYALRAKMGALGVKKIAQSVVRVILSSAGMGIGVWATAGAIFPLENRTSSGLLIGVAACIGIGFSMYGAISFVLKSPELSSVLAEARKGSGKK
jgi:putative peptidoglycan lipid II flippase